MFGEWEMLVEELVDEWIRAVAIIHGFLYLNFCSDQ